MITKSGADWMIESIAAYERGNFPQAIAASLIYTAETLEMIRAMIDPKTPPEAEYPDMEKLPK